MKKTVSQKMPREVQAKILNLILDAAELGPVQLTKFSESIRIEVMEPRDAAEPLAASTFSRGPYSASIFTVGPYAGEPLSCIGDPLIAIINRYFPGSVFMTDGERTARNQAELDVRGGRDCDHQGTEVDGICGACHERLSKKAQP